MSYQVIEMKLLISHHSNWTYTFKSHSLIPILPSLQAVQFSRVDCAFVRVRNRQKAASAIGHQPKVLTADRTDHWK